MNLFDLPLLEALAGTRNVLVAGAGGGFDVFGGLPLFFALRRMGKNVHLGNLSFSRLDRATGRLHTPALLEITHHSTGPEAYFPELHLCRFLHSKGMDAPVYCFDQTGVAPLADAYRHLATMLALDAVVLVDGGTDSLMRGDEVGLGTPQEDAASILAVNALDVPHKMLVCIGFGVDTYHGVCHADFLRAVAELTEMDAFLGAFTVSQHMPEVRLYIQAVEATQAAMPAHPSIVSNSILSALEGRFGNFHRTERTAGSELFINPLMCMYWAFMLDAVAGRILYADEVRGTQTYSELTNAIAGFRARYALRGVWRDCPF